MIILICLVKFPTIKQGDYKMTKKIDALLKKDAEKKEARKEQTRLISESQSIPADIQITFLKELLMSKDEYRKFKSSPIEYLDNHNMSFSSKLMQDVNDFIMSDETTKSALEKQISEKTLKDLIDIKKVCRSSLKASENGSVAASASAAVIIYPSIVVAVNIPDSTYAARTKELKIIMPKGKILTLK